MMLLSIVRHSRSSVKVFASALLILTFSASLASPVWNHPGLPVRVSAVSPLVSTGFSINPLPSVLPILVGWWSFTNITVMSVGGFSGTVSLTASLANVSLAKQFTLFLNRTSLPISSGGGGGTELWIFTDPLTPPGNYTVTVTGTSGSIINSTHIIAPITSFAMSTGPGSINIPEGSSGSFQISLTSLNGFFGVMDLTEQSCQSGQTCPLPRPVITISPSTPTLAAGGSLVSTMTVSTTSATPVSVIEINMTATGFFLDNMTGIAQTLSRSTILYATVTGFGVSVNPSLLSVSPGSSASVALILTSEFGFGGSVSLSSYTFPSGPILSPSFFSVTLPAYGSASSTLTIGVPSSTPPGLYWVNSTGVSNGQVHTTLFGFAVTPIQVNISNTTTFHGVTVTTSGTLSVNTSSSNPTLSGTITVTATNTTAGGLKFSKTYSVSGLSLVPNYSAKVFHSVMILTIQNMTYALSSDIEITFSGASAPLVSVTVTRDVDIDQNGVVNQTDVNILNLSYNCKLGQACFNPKADLDANGIVDFTDVTILLQSVGSIDLVPDYLISGNPVNVGPLNAGVTGTSTISLTGTNGFSGTVSLALSSSSGLTASLATKTLTLVSGGTSSTSLTVSASTAGTYLVTVNATSGPLSQTVSIEVVVTDFTISPSTLTLVCAAGACTTSIVLGSVNGFRGPIALTVSSSSGITVTLLPSSVTLSPGGAISSQVDISATGVGTYTFTVTGASGSLFRTASSVTVNVIQLPSTVGGTVLPVDKLGLILGILPWLSVLMAGIGAAVYIRRRMRKTSRTTATI